MEIIREENIIVLKNDKDIEKYNLNEEINFKGLVEYLLNLNLSEKVQIEDKLTEKTETEENLINLIEQIVKDYNDKVEELERFKAEN